MKLKLLFLFASLLTFSPKVSGTKSLWKSSNDNVNIFKDILNYFNLSFGIIFYCDSVEADVWIDFTKHEMKYFSFFEVSSPVFNLSNSWNIMRYENRQLGIYFDTSCNETEEIFEEFSRSNFFNASYVWLMMTDDSKSFIKLLSFQNINLDAEITVAVRTDQETTNLLDVYNPNSRTNGEIIIQAKGTWDAINGLNITLTGSKFDRRSNLQGIYIHSGVVASAVPEHQTLREYMESDENPLSDTQHRHNYRLFKILSEKHNFK